MPDSEHDSLQTLAHRLFEADAGHALALLDGYGRAPHEREVERVRRAVLQLSGGDLERLGGLIASAKADYRDVLWWWQRRQDGS